MAINTTNIIGDIFLPDGTVIDKSFIIFRITGYDTDADSDAVIVPKDIRAPIDALGAIDVDLWPNPDGVRATFYKVAAELYNGVNPALIDLGKISVPAAGGPYDINDLLPVAPPSGATVADYIAYLAAAVASTEAAADSAEIDALAAAASAAEAALYDGIRFDSFSDFITSTLTFTAGTLVQIRDIGATYQAAAGTGNLGQTNAGGQEFDVLPKANGAYSVNAFGLVGDGIADETAVIQAAVDALPTGTNSMNTLEFSAGIYKISGRIDLVSNLHIKSIGSFLLTETSTPFFFYAFGKENIVLELNYIDGNKETFSYTPQGGARNIDVRSRYSPIFAESCNDITVKNTDFVDCYSAGIFIHGGGFVDEKPFYRGVRIEGCSYTGGNLEFCVVNSQADIVVDSNRVFSNSNTWGLSSHLCNGMIFTANSNLIVTNNVIESIGIAGLGGAGAKVQSVVGRVVLDANHIEEVDVGWAMQESGIEQGGVNNHNEVIVVSNNTFRDIRQIGIGAESSGNPQYNVTVIGNIFDRIERAGITLSGKNWNITGNSFIGDPVDYSSGAAVSPHAILLSSGNGLTIEDIVISDNIFNENNLAATSARQTVSMGYISGQNMSLKNVSITGNIFKDFMFRGVNLSNNVFATDVSISDNTFVKTTLDGSASSDIYAFNADHALRWSVFNNTVAQRIIVNLTNAGSRVALSNNVVTAQDARDSANAYQVSANGAVRNIFDLGTRLVGFATSVPVIGDWAVGDIVYHKSPAAGGFIGWICTTAGTPGTWKTFGVISA